MLTHVMEDYLKTIYTMQGEKRRRVSTSAVAESLDVKPSSVTSMMKRLAERGLVDREEYNGVRLTEADETIAVEVLRHHRLLETYLTERLDYDWADVHEEADILEHHISETFEQRIADVLGDPHVDPHGAPIPTTDLDPVTDSGTALSEYGEGEVVVVTQVSDRDADQLAYLANAGVTPGTRMAVTEVAPFGMVTVRPEDQDTLVSLPENVARTVYARSDTDRQEVVA